MLDTGPKYLVQSISPLSLRVHTHHLSNFEPSHVDIFWEKKSYIFLKISKTY